MADIAQPETRLEFVERTFGHRFRDADLLLLGCTHASRLPHGPPGATRAASNERLEFLGDALLGAAVAAELYARHPADDEGVLSRLKSTLVSRAALARAGERSGLFVHCLVGAQVGGQWPDSVKANLVEGLLAAVFLDGGWPALAVAVGRLLAADLDDRSAAAPDARMALQELCFARHQRLPQYRSARSGGSDHAPEFTSTVEIAGVSATASGGSRKRAEAAAAEALLRILQVAPDRAGEVGQA